MKESRKLNEVSGDSQINGGNLIEIVLSKILFYLQAPWFLIFYSWLLKAEHANQQEIKHEKKKPRRKLEWIGARRKVCLHYCIQLWIIYLSINRTVTPHNINMVHGYDFTGTVTSIPLHSFLTLFAIEFSFSIFSTPFDSNLVHLIFNTWYTFHFTASSINYNLHNNDRRMN